MYKKNCLSILLLLLNMLVLSAQERETAEFGEPTDKELQMTSFPEDIEAAAVILFEQGKYFFKQVNNRYIRLYKEVHRKIKVIDAKKFDGATIEIPLLIGKKDEEKLSELKAITHNDKLKKYVSTNDVFNINQSKDIKLTRFTFPDIKDGSILEYKYVIESPFFFNLNGWEFQHNIPTLYSEFLNEIPGNFKYNRVLKGGRKLDIDEASIKKNCFYIEGYTPADCESTIYVMKNIPAFKNESYMLAKSNYLASVEYELKEFLDYSGLNNKFTKTWEDVDDEFKTDKDIGRQLNNNNFLKRNLPENILNISDELNKAKAIYTFIQGHFKWNEKQRLFNDVRVRDAFESKVGNTSEINLALINALQAADLDAKLVLISTRENGLPTFTYPVLTDFNHAIVLLTVNDEKILLDAVEQETPFGIIPFQDLNGKGRVMDFKNGSYWYPLTPHKKNMYYINAQLKASEEGLFTGKINEIQTGYVAIKERKHIKNSNYRDYINQKEKNASIKISNLTIENKTNLEKPLKIDYDIALETELIGDKVYINPYFFNTYFSENPFKSDERNFPINFGYPITTTYLMSIDLEDKYTVEQLPENKTLNLFDNIGQCTVIYTENNGKINIRFSFQLTESNFIADVYPGIKQFFTAMIDFQKQDPILLKKV
ncbi:transglutaminase-like domain-containing protein [uncultured Marixanthomonas sp.]|uniref:transglutaminase-like domain-containing protein n=1 Tax=uncultured Marixanthomonas sp. TaxID=757245 RepID=UPI0030D98912